MSLPNTLRELQELCKLKNLKFKGKTKSQLKEVLEDGNEAAENVEVELVKKSVKELKEMCELRGLSKVGNKAELCKRLESMEDSSVEGLRVVKWKKRGRKVPTRPSESVMVRDDSDDESDEVGNDLYKNMKKQELRQECLKRNIPASGSNKILIKRLVENDDISKQVQSNHHEKLCESCEENPMKLHKSSISKLFCSDCDQYICNICKSAHEKLKITRTHEIRPYGTILDFNIGNDVSFNPVVEPPVEQVEEAAIQFMDFTVEAENSKLKIKRDEIVYIFYIC